MLPPDRESIDEKTRSRLTRAASYASLSVALTLVVAKFWAWQATDAVSVLSSLVDSFLDVFASAITFLAVRFALQPADREHRFGHGKSEGLAALAQSVIIAGSALFVCTEAIDRIMNPARLTEPLIGLSVIVGSTLLTVALLGFQRLVVRQTRSVAIAADAMHYKADVLVNAGVAIAIPVSAWTSWTYADPVIGLAIAAYIMWGTYGIATKSLDLLLDREIPETERQRIREIAMSHPAVLGFHDLRTRSGGPSYIIQFHLELAPETSLIDSHVILDDVEGKIRKEFGHCEIIVHADPLGFPERRDRFE
jgi:ferrous-iron efflux pump FieF